MNPKGGRRRIIEKGVGGLGIIILVTIPSDEIPYSTIEAVQSNQCFSRSPRTRCIAYSLINLLRDTIKEKIQVGDSSIDTLL